MGLPLIGCLLLYPSSFALREIIDGSSFLCNFKNLKDRNRSFKTTNLANQLSINKRYK